MKKLHTTIKALILSGALLVPVISLLAQIPAQTPVVVPVKLQKTIVQNRLPNELRIPDNVRSKIMIKRIDLSTTAIDFSVVSCKDKFNGTVKIEGVIKNTGGLAYTSGADQQAVFLYEDNGGRPRLVATRAFQNLTPGQEVRVSYTRQWYKGTEFPPKYILIIGFDPDIYIDSNDNNDDVNTANNRMERSGADLSGLTFNCK
jgi:hypothetical protein